MFGQSDKDLIEEELEDMKQAYVYWQIARANGYRFFKNGNITEKTADYTEEFFTEEIEDLKAELEDA